MLEFIYNLFNYDYNLLNVRTMKLQGYMKITIEASPTRVSYAELTTKGSFFYLLFIRK